MLMNYFSTHTQPQHLFTFITLADTTVTKNSDLTFRPSQEVKLLINFLCVELEDWLKDVDTVKDIQSHPKVC